MFQDALLYILLNLLNFTRLFLNIRLHHSDLVVLIQILGSLKGIKDKKRIDSAVK